MNWTFRQAMTWMHTWLGLVLGFVLMVVFFFGSLSVFDREIDRWAIPQTRFEPQPMPSFDQVLRPLMAQIEPSAVEYAAKMPLLHDANKGPMTPRSALPIDEFWAYTTHRDPVLLVGADFSVPHPRDPAAHNHIHARATIDPRTGVFLNDDQLKVGSAFFYPLHYSLHLRWKNAGYFIVGLAAFIMLAALVSGVIIHRRLFREFFTFRPRKHLQRSTLDLHNLTGVLALPFHFFFAFTGLVIFAASIYLPLGHTVLKPLHDRHAAQESARTGLPQTRAGVNAPMASVDAMVADARRRWSDRGMPGQVGFLKVHHLGDTNSYVSIYRAGSDRVALVGEGIHFQANTGRVLHEDPPREPASAVHQFLTGLHLQHFEHWLLRWLYVAGGLLGCVCIATGFVFFVEKRKQQHARQGSAQARVVDALGVATVTGMLLATSAMLLVNRLLPADLNGAADWQIGAFWGVWLISLLHAAGRNGPVALGQRSPAWAEQCQALAVVAVAAVLANGWSTGAHLWVTVPAGNWPVAGVDLSLLTTAAIAWVAHHKLKRQPAMVTAHTQRTSLPTEATHA